MAVHTGMRVGRVRVIFSIPGRSLPLLFPGAPVTRPTVPRHLVYVEWLSKFANAPDPLYQMYKIKTLQGPASLASIVLLSLIQRSVHLHPKWGGPAPVHWTSTNVLDECTTFYLNHHQSPHSFYNMY